MKIGEIGDRKIVKKFAWLPIKINNNIAWLRCYNNIYECKKRKIYLRSGQFYSRYWDLIDKI